MSARSMLFVTATGGPMLAKAFQAGADAVIVDLEDSVAVDEKAAAREALAAFLSLPGWGRPWVRVNATSTPHCLQDLEALPIAALAGIVLPKVEAPADVHVVDWVLSQLESASGLAPQSVPLLGMVETARGLTWVDAIAAASPRLRRLAFGAVDFAHDLQSDLDDDAASSLARFAIARASRVAHRELPIDAPLIDLNDLDRLRGEARRARALGFGGKLCIHPRQVPVVNEAFRPTADEVQRALRIVEAFARAEAEGKAAVAVDGLMVDYPVAERARRVLALAGRS
jgi:citrate lyase subunit beta/citryl-CoA lyase